MCGGGGGGGGGGKTHESGHQLSCALYQGQVSHDAAPVQMHASLLLCAYITVSVSHASLFIIQMLHCSEGKQAKYASSVTTNKLTLFNKMYEYTDCCECQCNVY